MSVYFVYSVEINWNDRNTFDTLVWFDTAYSHAIDFQIAVKQLKKSLKNGQAIFFFFYLCL